MTARMNRAGWLFVGPFVLVTVTFMVIPFVLAAIVSLTDMTAADMRNPLAVDFIGLETIRATLTNSAFQQAVVTTIKYYVLTVPTTMFLGLLAAIALDSGIRRLKATFRAAIYIPVVTNIVAAAVIWKYAFAPSGPVNAALSGIGIAGPHWLSDPNWALLTVASLGIWRNVGTAMILFLAGLQSIPATVNEAAAVDGAGAFRTFRSITLPLLRPTTLLVVVLMSVWFLNILEEPLVLTGGGPVGTTTSAALWVYEQFGFGNTAMAMAGSVLMLVGVGVIALIQFKVVGQPE